MNRFLAILILVGAAACHSDATGPTSTAPLSGKVSSQSGPISNARVVATDTSDASRSDTVSTNASGQYAFDSVSPGTRTVSLVASSLPPACIPPVPSNVTIVANGRRAVNLQVLCVDVTGAYTGFLKVKPGGAAATFDSILVSLGAAGLFPDSGAFQLIINPIGTNTFQFGGHYSGVGYAASWIEDTVTLNGGPVVETNWPIVMPSITFDGVVTVQPVCTPSGPAQFTVGVDSLAGGHLTDMSGTLDYDCSVTLTGIGAVNGTFHMVLKAEKS